MLGSRLKYIINAELRYLILNSTALALGQLQIILVDGVIHRLQLLELIQ